MPLAIFLYIVVCSGIGQENYRPALRTPECHSPIMLFSTFIRFTAFTACFT